MKKTTFLFLVLVKVSIWAQNGGDTCGEAISVTPGSFTEVLITQDSAGGEQGTAQPRDAAWYVFTPEEDGLLSLSSCSSNVDTRVFIGTGICGELETQAQSDDDCNLQSEIINFSVTAEVPYYIEWDDRWSASAFDWSLSFIPASSCQPPSALNVENITNTGATLIWETLSDTSSYEWVVMNSGEDPTDTNNIPAASGTTDSGILSVLLTDLSSNSVYEAYVRAVCDSNISIYTPATSFITECDPFVPEYLESFEAGLVPPQCWLEASNGNPTEGPMNVGEGSWRADDYLNDEVASGGADNAARINLFFNLEEDWLISPQFDLSSGDYELAYNVAVTAFGNQNPSEMGSDDEVQVLISTDEGNTWQTLTTYNSDNTPSNLGQEEIIDLATYDGIVRFAFWATDGTINDLEDYDFFIDEFKVRTPLNCTVPELSYNEIPDCENDQFTITVEVTDLGSSPSLVISDDFGSDDQSVNESDILVTFGPYPSGTAVVITITGDDENCTVTQNFQYSCPPENDLCPDATALITGEDFDAQAVIATNVDATDSGSIATTCGNYDGGDVWFTAVVPDDGILTIETKAADESPIEDTGLEVYSGMCEALVLIECSDDISTTDLFSAVTINDVSLVGETIFIRTWEWSNDAFGEFQISVYNENILNIDTAEKASILLYPNPVESIIRIRNFPPFATGFVSNSLGQRVMEISSDRIDVSALKSGMYFVTIQDDLELQTLRFIKK